MFICAAGCTSYYVTAAPAVFVVLSKMSKHSAMLQQMADFDMRAAKCALESDRRLVEKRLEELLTPQVTVSNLYPESVETGLGVPMSFQAPFLLAQNAEPLDSFNGYVRGPLREKVLQQIGDDMHVPYRLCLVASLPMVLYGLVDVLSCSGVDCNVNAKELGMSAPEYMGTLSGFWLLNLLMVYPIAQPNLFRMLRCICSAFQYFSTRIFFGLLCVACLYTHIFLCSGLLLALTLGQFAENSCLVRPARFRPITPRS